MKHTMNNKICIVLYVIVLIISNGITFGLAKMLSMDSNVYTHPINENSLDTDTICKIDYPLIDIYFDDKEEWTVLIRQNMHMAEKSEEVYLANHADVLEWNKEFLKVLTFPSGKGTTPMGEICIYKNHVLIKTVEFIEIDILNEALKKEFSKANKKDILKMTGN